MGEDTAKGGSGGVKSNFEGRVDVQKEEEEEEERGGKKKKKEERGGDPSSFEGTNAVSGFLILL